MSQLLQLINIFKIPYIIGPVNEFNDSHNNEKHTINVMYKWSQMNQSGNMDYMRSKQITFKHKLRNHNWMHSAIGHIVLLR